MIKKLLVANRGEIARRIMRTCRDLGIATVAVYSDPDTAAPFVAEADEAVAIGGANPAESYLRADVVIDAALATGADAVHPGYGFLSENAAFARACLKAQLVWVGPPASAIDLMGSKLAARALMTDSGVAVLPGADLSGCSDQAALEAADEIGWPILVKASFGGGGRGMRVVREPDGLIDAIASARREAESAFGDGTVFLEHYVDEPRHVEIQIFGDTHGSMVHLFERECSIQRRHQKIIEEAPSPAVGPELRTAMGAAAIAAGQAIGYVGAGTVEFLLTPSAQFFFLEVNTRLQVEHPVTEAVTDLDLVALQLAVAEGKPLPPAATAPTINGHAIEARLYAEDPLASFLPMAGTVSRFDFPALDGLRVDSGVEAGSVVSVNYDPMLAKVVAHGATRDEAVRKLAAGLRRARLHGITTNRDLLVAILEHPEFEHARIDTHFLERHPPASLVVSTEDHSGHIVAAAMAEQASARQTARVWAHAPPGWRNSRSDLQRRTYKLAERTVEIGYRVDPEPYVEVDGAAFDLAAVNVRDLPSGAGQRVEFTVGTVRRRYDVEVDGSSVYVDTNRSSLRLERQPRFPESGSRLAPGSLLAPMPGTVVRVNVSEGDRVMAGQVLLIMEAMKMEHAVTAPTEGIVSSLRVTAGLAVSNSELLAVIEAVETPEDAIDTRATVGPHA